MDNTNHYVDIIIPVYKLKGLKESLCSIGRQENARVTLVDDGQFNDYSEFQEFFNGFFDLQIIQLEKNVGQGLARQAGVNNTHGEYFMFIDCGDLLFSPYVIEQLLNAFSENKNCMYTQLNCIFESDKNIYESGRFQINGQMYRRSFVEKYNVRFSNEDLASRCLEDFG